MGKKNLTQIILIVLFVFTFGLRLYSGYKQYAGDVNNHIGWAQDIVKHGYKGFYERAISDVSIPNYPPLSVISFVLSLQIYDSTVSVIHDLNNSFAVFPSRIVWLVEQKNTLALFMKIPAIAGDGLLALGVFLFARDIYKRRHPKLWSLAVLANPALFYVSAVWGQIESLVISLVILAAYLAIQKKLFWSIVFFGFAALTKQTALWLLPVFAIIWIEDLGVATKGFIATFLMSFILYLPFYGANFAFIPSYLKTLSGSSELTSDKAYNLWYFVAGMRPDSLQFGPLSIRIWSLVFLCFGFFVVLLWYAKNKSSVNFIRSIWIMSLMAFFLQTRVHERHLYPAVVTQLLLKNRSANIGYIILSIYFMVNLYWSLGLSFF